MSITQRWNDLQGEIRELTDRSVRVCAVTKTRPADDVRAIVAAGAQIVGENRVEEAITKYHHGGLRQQLQGTAVHMIGHLQSRKARDAVNLFDCIQSVDSLKLAREISKRCTEAERALDVLVEVNVSGEAQKFGVPVENAAELVEVVCELPSIRLKGLMTMAPYTDDTDVQRSTFRGLRELSEELGGRFGAERFETLSMGMTNDYRIAIEEGSTMIRLGSYFFS